MLVELLDSVKDAKMVEMMVEMMVE